MSRNLSKYIIWSNRCGANFPLVSFLLKVLISSQVVLVFHKPFWPEPDALGGYIAGDVALKIMYYPYVASKTGTPMLFLSKISSSVKLYLKLSPQVYKGLSVNSRTLVGQLSKLTLHWFHTICVGFSYNT